MNRFGKILANWRVNQILIIAAPKRMADLASLITSNVVASAVMFAGVWLLGQLVRPEEFGQFSVAAAFALAISPLLTLRLELAIPIARMERTARVLSVLCLAMSTILLSVVYLALSVSEMMCLDLTFLPTDVSVLLLPTVGLVFTLSIDKIAQSIAFRKNALRVLAATRIIRAVALVGFQVFLVCTVGANASSLLFGQLLSNALMSILLATQLGLFSWLFNVAEWKRLWRSLVPLIWKFRAFPAVSMPHAFLHSFFSATYGMVIGLLYGSVAVGQFYMMIRILFGVTDLVATALNQQGIAEAANREQGELQAVSKYVIFSLLIITVPISICAFFFGEQLFVLVLGETWAQAGQFAAASVARVVMEPIAAALSFLPNFLHKQRQAFAWSIIQNLAGLLLLVTAYRLGLDVGAAIAISATGMSVIMLACVIWLWRISGLSATAQR